jgi:hypothetical protein
VASALDLHRPPMGHLGALALDLHHPLMGLLEASALDLHHLPMGLLEASALDLHHPPMGRQGSVEAVDSEVVTDLEAATPTSTLPLRPK